MKSSYLRPTNFIFGFKAKKLINKNEAKSLFGLDDVAFASIEILKRDSLISNKLKISEITINNFSEENFNDLKKLSIKKNFFLNLDFYNPQIIGVLNVTPDSFSDGGKFMNSESAIIHVKNMINAGATIIDIGGESTRPGALTIDSSEEIKRIDDIIKLIKKNFPKQLISLDTRKSKVMKFGVENNVDLFNDVSALDYDDASVEVVKESKKPIILSHSQGNPENMQVNPNYDNVLLDIYDYFENKINFLINNKGISENQIIIDPGIGFGKTLEHNLQLISKISLFHTLGYPVMIGPSRKSFIGRIMNDNNTLNRLGGTLAAVLYAYQQGIQIFRLHDINEAKQALKVYSQFLIQE